MADTTWTQQAGMTSDEDTDNLESYSEQAEAAKDAAAASEAAAAASESNASASATSASNSASAASTSATAAQTAQTAAELAETNAETAETNAETAETNAAASAAAALASETAAAASEAGVDADRVAAQTAATAAAASETAAATSEANAATSETNAANSATASASSATASAASATAASASETAAASSETAAAASESAAGVSETNAAASETAAAASETAAASSASSASTSASNAASSASSASASADAALAALDNFDDRYLGQKASDPTLDNDGDALVAGALYFNTTDDVMKVYEGSVWVAAYASLSGALLVANNLSDVSDASAGRTNLGLGTGDSPTFAGLTTTGNVSFGDSDKAIFGAGSDLQVFHDGSNSYIKEVGTGLLSIQTNGAEIAIQGRTGSEYMARFQQDGWAKLFFDNAEKLATTSTGIDVTGTVTADGLTVEPASGNGLLEVSGGSDNSFAYLRLTSKLSGAENYTNIFSDYSASINFQHDDGRKLALFSHSGDISFYEDTGTTPKFFWDASTERLGIGTSSPSTPLDVVSSTNPVVKVRSDNVSTGAQCVVDGGSSNDSTVGLLSSGTYVYGLFRDGSQSNDLRLLSYTDTAGATDVLRYSVDGSLRFGTSASERMRITSAGDLEMTGGGSVGWANWTITESGGSLYFATGGTNKMKLDASGNLQVVGNVESNATIT